MSLKKFFRDFATGVGAAAVITGAAGAETQEKSPEPTENNTADVYQDDTNDIPSQDIFTDGATDIVECNEDSCKVLLGEYSIENVMREINLFPSDIDSITNMDEYQRMEEIIESYIDEHQELINSDETAKKGIEQTRKLLELKKIKITRDQINNN